MQVFTLTVLDIPADDTDNWNSDEPFTDEWLLRDQRHEIIAVLRAGPGLQPEDALNMMAADRLIFRDWTGVEDAGTNWWRVHWHPG